MGPSEEFGIVSHWRKVLQEQINIINRHVQESEELNLEFVALHSLIIVQICNQIMKESNCMPERLDWLTPVPSGRN